jgi:hypothetical protein
MDNQTKKMRIKMFLDISSDEMLKLNNQTGLQLRDSIDALIKMEHVWDAKTDITLITGCLAKPGDLNWKTDGHIVRQLLEDFERLGIGDRVTSFIGANSLTHTGYDMIVKTQSTFRSSQVAQYLGQFDADRDDILFYLYGAPSHNDKMYFNHYMMDELKHTSFVYICTGGKKVFGRGRIFNCEHPNAGFRGDEFEFQPEKAYQGTVSLANGLKYVASMKRKITDNGKNNQEKAIVTAENFFKALGAIDDMVVSSLPDEKLMELFDSGARLQRLVLGQKLQLPPVASPQDGNG